MRVAVAGSHGFLGRAVAQALLAGGHTVVGLVRTPSQGDAIRRLGAIPAVADLPTGSGLAEGLAHCDLVVHLAQSRSPDLAERRRVRVLGGQHLLAYAQRAGVRRAIIGSGYWVYAGSDAWIQEESPLEPRSISLVNFETEEIAREAARRGGPIPVFLRPGMVYGNGSWFREMVREIGAGTYRYAGTGEQFLSPIHLEDAAEAFRVVAEDRSTSGTYLVVDDTPVTSREFAEAVSGMLGRPIPRGLEGAAAIQEWGEDLFRLESASRRCRNARLRTLGWAPKFPSYLRGVPGVLGEIESGRPPVDG